MAHAYPDPARDGTYKHFLPNGHGKCGSVGIQAGLTPKIQLISAGSGIQLVAADGVTPLLEVSEAGVVTPSGGSGVPLLLADPTTGDARFYRLAGVLKFWDGATAVEVVTT
jgi:hypothetical protein